MLLKTLCLPIFFSLCLTAAASASAGPEQDLAELAHRWARANYDLSGEAQKTAFKELVRDVERVTRRYPEQAEIWIWSGIIKSTFAGVRGGLGALKYAKQARSDLEMALKIDDQALQGAAYTTLGSLYYNVPGWPVGFGDDNKAEELLRKALEIDPDGIDSNYFYADYLASQKRYSEARDYFRKARLAPARPGRELADQGRQNEISAALAEIDETLQ